MHQAGPWERKRPDALAQSERAKAMWAAGLLRPKTPRVCPVCSEWFHPRSGPNIYCTIECKKRASRAVRYGLTFDQLAAIEARQGSMCAVCRQAGVLHVDHDHETGQVRGLLCIKCNTGIGKLMDSPELLRRAAGYLDSAVL